MYTHIGGSGSRDSRASGLALRRDTETHHDPWAYVTILFSEVFT